MSIGNTVAESVSLFRNPQPMNIALAPSDVLRTPLLLVGLSRVIEYSSTTRVVNYSSNFYYLSTRYFLFPVANLHFGCSFLQSIDELLELMETWDFMISFVCV